MKVIYSLLIAAFLVLSSCGSAKEAPLEQIISEIITGKAEKVNYDSDRSDSTICSIEYSYFADGKEVYKDSINQKIKDYVFRITELGNKPTEKPVISNAFFQSQLEKFVLVNLEEREDYDDGLNQLWELEAQIIIDNASDQFVQLQLSAWDYTGGAHGNGATVTSLIDKSNGRVLLIDDIFNDVSAVTIIAESYFRKLYDLDPDADLDDAGYWFENNQFHLNNNFTIGEHTIEFLYNSYEIAPYSGGSTFIEIPLNEVRNYLKIKL